LSSTLGEHENPLRAPFSAEERELVLSELRIIVSSPYFRHSKRYPAFLTYIVQKAIEADDPALKERIIGMEVFGRPTDYDTNSDPIVRNTASEVRKRLSLFHAESVPHSEVTIYLPSGSYQPEFRFRLKNPASLVEETISEKERIDSGLIPTNQAANTPTPAKIRKRWLLWFFPLVTLCVAGVIAFDFYFEKSPIDKLWTGFLNPEQTVLLGVPQAPAPANLNGPFLKGPLDEKELANWIKDNPDVAAEDVSAVLHAVKPLMVHNIPYSIQMDTRINLTDLRDRPVVLIGSLSNVWSMKLLAPLRFHFNMTSGLYIEDSQNPQSQQWRYVLAKNGDSHVSVVEDCAIVARFHDPTTGGMVMVIAGAGRNGTEAAGEFVTSESLLSELNKQLPRGWKNKNLEVVLQAHVIDGKTGSPSIAATYLW
jgi:hypothetical protein